jgi:uncharacterized protein YkwD
MGRRTAWLRGVVVLALTATLVLGAFVAPASAGTGYRARILHLVNATRAKHDLRKVSIDPSFTRDAMRHTRRMVRRNLLFDPPNLSNMLRDEPWQLVGSSVVGCASSLFRLHRAFMQDAPHRAIILDPRLRRIGIGAIKVTKVNRCGRGWFWATELFYG